MLFQDRHIPLIRAGEKTVTRRVWKPKKARPLPGSVHMAAAPSMVPDDADYDSPMFLSKRECTCFIRIDDDYGRDADREPLGAMTDADARLEGDYESVADFREAWVDINGEWDPEQVVDPVPFEYVGRIQPGEWPCHCAGERADWKYHSEEGCADTGQAMSFVGGGERYYPWEA